MPSKTRLDWLRREVLNRDVTLIQRTLRAVVRERLQTVENRPGAEADAVTVRYADGWFVFAPQIAGFEQERKISGKRLVQLLARAEDEMTAWKDRHAADTRSRLESWLASGWTVVKLLRRGSRVWGTPLSVNTDAQTAAAHFLGMVEEGRIAWEDVRRGDYLILPVRFLDWSKGMDPETTEDLVDWTALLRMERRALPGFDPGELDRVAQAAARAAEARDLTILIQQARTINGTLAGSTFDAHMDDLRAQR